MLLYIVCYTHLLFLFNSVVDEQVEIFFVSLLFYLKTNKKAIALNSGDSLTTSPPDLLRMK